MKDHDLNLKKKNNIFAINIAKILTIRGYCFMMVALV